LRTKFDTIQDLTKINIKEYKLDSKITSILVEETKVTKPLDIYQENNFFHFSFLKKQASGLSP